MADRARLWWMNADFEAELAAAPNPYRPKPTIARRNAKLSEAWLWFARAGDEVLIDAPPAWSVIERARSSGVRFVSPDDASSGLEFRPWGWTRRALELAESIGAVADAPPLEAVARVNSKVFSHELEQELGVAVPGAALARDFDGLEAAACSACPRPNDKWVIKSVLGFAARERVLGRGPSIDEPSAKWARERFARGEALLFEPWLDVSREYGVQLSIGSDRSVAIAGISTMTTNGAGVTTGFVLGKHVDRAVRDELEALGRRVGERLASEGYFGPANVDALEHAGGLRPLLEINARHTMGLVALAVETRLGITEPCIWRPPGMAIEQG